MNFLEALIGKMTATPGARDATPPLPGALQAGGATAVIVTAVGKAAGIACTGYAPTAAFAGFCDSSASWVAASFLGILSGLAVGTYTGVVKKIKNVNTVPAAAVK